MENYIKLCVSSVFFQLRSHVCIYLFDALNEDKAVTAWLSDVTFSIWACTAHGSFTVLCVAFAFPAKKPGLMQSRMKWDSCGSGGRLTERPWEYMWHWSASAAKHVSVGREERSSLSVISTEWAVSPRYFSFSSPEWQFILTPRVYDMGRNIFFSPAWIRKRDLGCVTLSQSNSKDGLIIVPDKAPILCFNPDCQIWRMEEVVNYLKNIFFLSILLLSVCVH